MEAKLELGDDPEVAATAAQAPEELGLFGLAGLDEVALGGDQIDRDELVDRQPVLAMKPADTTAERQACDAGVGDDSARRREPERLGLAVELAQSTPAWTRPSAPPGRRGSPSSAPGR